MGKQTFSQTECARKQLVEEDTKKPMTTLKEISERGCYDPLEKQ